MSLQSKEVVIEDRIYNIIPFNAVDALKYQIRLAPLFKGLSGSLTNLENDGGQLLNIFIETLSSLDPDKTLELITDLLKNIRDKEKGQLNLISMTGNDLAIVYKLIFELIRVNYGDFFNRLIGLFSNQQIV